MNIASFLEKVKQTPTSIEFQETIAIVDSYYEFAPTSFTNGLQFNEIGQNSGSCKLFAFAQLNDLSQAETLACFGAYYFDEVLGNPEGTNHQNIRNFIKSGWSGIQFEGEVLIPRF